MVEEMGVVDEVEINHVPEVDHARFLSNQKRCTFLKFITTILATIFIFVIVLCLNEFGTVTK